MNQQGIEPTVRPMNRPRCAALAARLLREAACRERSGQAMTEFTLVVPLLLLIIYAMIIFALAIHTQIDFGNAISSGVRTATVLGDGSALPVSQSAQDVDAMIGQAMTQNLRADDRGSVTQFSVQLIQGRPAVVPDANASTGIPANTYEDVYKYYPGTQTFHQDAYDAAPAVSIPGVTDPTDPCQYYYQAHVVSRYTYNATTMVEHKSVITYIDQAELIPLWSVTDNVTDILTVNPRYPDPNSVLYSSFQAGCGRHYAIDSRPLANRMTWTNTDVNVSYLSSWDCSYAYTGAAYSGSNGGHLCYYYPTERNIQVDSGGAFPLPDLVEVALTYLYDPIPTEISSKTPIGNGFTLVEHARGRLEPASIPQ